MAIPSKSDRSPIHLGHSDVPHPHSIGEPTPGAKITILKTIFSQSENQHPAVVAVHRRGLTSGYPGQMNSPLRSAKRQPKC
jgi:hypothetical protein